MNKNVTKAIGYYNGALLNGYLTKSAAANLAFCYQQGLGGLEKNEKTANEILKLGKEESLWSNFLREISFE